MEHLGIELHLGLPAELEPRVATMLTPPPPADPKIRELLEKFMGPDTLMGRALSGPSGHFSYGPIWNTRALHAAEIPSSNAIASILDRSARWWVPRIRRHLDDFRDGAPS